MSAQVRHPLLQQLLAEGQRRGLGAAALARRAGVARNTFYNGRTNVEAATIEALARCLGMELRLAPSESPTPPECPQRLALPPG